MVSMLRTAGLGLLLTAAACQQTAPNSADTSAQTAPRNAATPAVMAPGVTATAGNIVSAASSAASDTALVRSIMAPRLNDVYVVVYQPAGGSEKRYFFYRVSKVGEKTVDLLPARQESTDPAADVSVAGFFSDKPLTYTRVEALELMQEQPGDVQHTHLIRIRREER